MSAEPREPAVELLDSLAWSAATGDPPDIKVEELKQKLRTLYSAAGSDDTIRVGMNTALPGTWRCLAFCILPNSPSSSRSARTSSSSASSSPCSAVATS